MQRGQTLKLTPTHWGPEGEGVATVDGIDIRVTGATIGDNVVARVEHLSPHQPVAWGAVVDVVSRGDTYAKPPCHHAAPTRGACGGCPVMHLTPDAALAVRRGIVAGAFADAGLEADVSWQTAGKPLGYRNRSKYLVAGGPDGSMRLGSRARRTGEFAPMGGCRVVHERVDAAALAVAAAAPGAGVPADGDATPGVRWVAVRCNRAGEVLVELIVRPEIDREALTLLARRVCGRDGIVGVIVSESDAGGNAIAGTRPKIVAGVGEIVESVGGIDLTLAHDAFFQLNTAVAEAMYQRAAVEVRDGAPVWDVYCGVGGLGLVACRGRDVALHGWESHARAVEAARANAKAAGMAATFKVADLRSVPPYSAARPGTVFLNPPRRGLDALVRDTVSALEDATLVYMSCDPASFATDARALLGAGWHIGAVEAWDMLPQTTHVELLATFRR